MQPEIREPSRREHIMATIEDLVADFLYYDRKEDEDLPVGEIELAIEAGEISFDEIVDTFRAQLSIGMHDGGVDGG